MGNQQSNGGNITPRSRQQLTKEEVASLPLVRHFVYASLSEHVYNEPDRRKLPDGWKMLMTADEVELNKEGYYAAAYINDRLKHCIIAERGTHDALGIRAGVWMYFDEPTIQFALAEQFSKLVRLRLALTKEHGGATPYFVSYTGHSLGAVLAACRAVAEHTYAITFESPGCRAFVEKTMHPFKADDVDIITYLRSPNPINTLRPQCGYLVQLPYLGPGDQSSQGTASGGGGSSTLQPGGATADGKKPPTSGVVVSKIEAAKTKLTNLPKVVPNPQEFLRQKLIERGIPEIQQYVSKIEPLLKEMLNHTEQIHSISSIVSNFEKQGNGEDLDDEPIGQDVVLTWPSHLMQYLEYFNTIKAMEDPANQDPNVLNAYTSLMQKLYLTAKRPKHRMPMKFLNKDSQKLVKLWSMLPAQQLEQIPLQNIERKALNTTSIIGGNMETRVLTSFQMKQLLSLIVSRPQVHTFLDTFTFDISGTVSKL